MATILLVDDDPFLAYAHRMALEPEFASIERAADASEAFIRVEQRDFAENLALIIVGLRLPGLAGPAFVSELAARVPGVPLLVIGRDGETAAEYSDQSLRFLPRDTSSDDLLAEVRSMFPGDGNRGSLRLVERRF